MDDRARASLTLLEGRVGAVASHVAALLASPPAPPTALADAEDVTVTGVGAAAGPARHLAALLAARRRARFVPVSTFAHGAGSARGTLVLFSQHLSPNAKLVLARAGDAARIVLVTAASAPEIEAATDPAIRARLEIVPHAPQEERGTLLRVTGPAVATVVAVLLARSADVHVDDAALARLPDILRDAPARFARVTEGTRVASAWERPLAVVTAGELGHTARAVAWKLLEGLAVAEPPAWDVLEIAHGPFQQFFAREMCLVALATPADRPLLDRLSAMLAPDRHALLVLPSELPPALAPVEHDALANELVLAGLRARPRDLARWDGQGLDGPLYELGATPEGGLSRSGA